MATKSLDDRLTGFHFVANPNHLETIDASKTQYPSILTAVRETAELGSETSTLYGFVVEGSVNVRLNDVMAQLKEKGYFSAPGLAKIEIEDGLVVVIERLGYRGMQQVGQSEKRGRLSYIDGCSDSMLVQPARLGDPVFNLLYFPPNIVQTQHTHPSIRMGVVASGTGVAKGPNWEQELTQGGIFMLNEQALHHFETSKDSMRVIAYHPDSDWGPTDHSHPMLNRTYTKPE